MSSLLSMLTPEQWASIPLLQPPAGVVSNFVNPENENRHLLAVTSLLLAILAIVFANRAYCKIAIVRRFTWDDCMSDEPYC